MIWTIWVGLTSIIACLSYGRSKIFYPAIIIIGGLLVMQFIPFLFVGKIGWLAQGSLWIFIAWRTSIYNPFVAFCLLFSGISYLAAFGFGSNITENYSFFLISDFFGLSALLLLGGGYVRDGLIYLIHNYFPSSRRYSYNNSEALSKEKEN